MGTDKFLLPHPSGQPLYLHLLSEIRRTIPWVDDVHLSLHSPAQGSLVERKARNELHIIYDGDAFQDGSDSTDLRIGPAAGLLSAYRQNSSAHWFVLACDYPLITAQELFRLMDEFEDPVTCFENSDGFIEPLLSIWSPDALKHLELNVANGKYSVSRVIQELSGKRIRPIQDQSVFNCNTMEEWHKILQLLESAPK
jgi:molybdopterin-guanine dinucleotide biosynthesis protein A